MTLAEYQSAVSGLSFGKRLPTAVYVFHAWTDPNARLGDALDPLLARLRERLAIGNEYNVLKFRTDEFKISFLSYPTFFDEAHPALAKALTVDLATGKSRLTEYADNLNPPILHRKETFLPLTHPRRAEFAKLTAEEEAAGLYAKTSTIGFRLNWEKLLADKRLRIDGHQLIAASDSTAIPGVFGQPPAAIDRHRTALSRYDLSKPVKTMIESAVLKPGLTFFDYGCGRGADVQGLRSLGYLAQGWDPAFFAAEPRAEADVVNLGYVLNVIEDPVERVEALVQEEQRSGILRGIAFVAELSRAEISVTVRNAKYAPRLKLKASRCVPMLGGQNGL
jgi:hypothetical protein